MKYECDMIYTIPAGSVDFTHGSIWVCLKMVEINPNVQALNKCQIYIYTHIFWNILFSDKFGSIWFNVFLLFFPLAFEICKKMKMLNQSSGIKAEDIYLIKVFYIYLYLKQYIIISGWLDTQPEDPNATHCQDPCSPQQDWEHPSPLS